MSGRIARWALFVFFTLVFTSRAGEAPAQHSPLTLAAPPSDPAISAFPVFTDPGEIPQLYVASSDVAPAARVALPLKHTAVAVHLSEFVAEVTVTQTFVNDRANPIEAIYNFPLPENAAVSAMTMKIADRKIEAKIAERAAARATYESAKRRGVAASLLEQERSNLFTQSVANIPPGESIAITVRYVQDLTYDAGVYEFVFPLVVGPRYMAGAPVDRPNVGSGTANDTTVVPDASRISPPYVGKGQRSGRTISLSITAAHELALTGYHAVTHQVTAETKGGLQRFALVDAEEIPNRDFVFRYRVAGEKPRAILQTAEDQTGFFTVVVDPPALDVDSLVGKRELVFVVDVSGSMSGAPLALCQAAMRTALTKLRPTDTFNVITFAGVSKRIFPTSRPANRANVKQAMDEIARLRAGGSTEMIDAVAAALSADVEAGRHRYVFFMTDGYVGAEDQIVTKTREYVTTLESKGQRAKVFGFGVGASPNRTLLTGLSKEGKGLTVYATNREDPARAVNAFYRYVDSSVLRDVSIDWGGGVVEGTPSSLPDLFASHPLIVHGRLERAPSRPPVLHATAASGPVSFPIQVVKGDAGAPQRVQGLLWGRQRIAELEVDVASGDAKARDQTKELGLRFSLVTPFTSFVAVDDRPSVEGPGDTVLMPHELPEGMDARPEPMNYALTSETVDAVSPRPAERSARGCACAMAERGASPWPWTLGLGLVGLLALRRQVR
jgi:Ca-activated chloride channel family protein